MLGQTTMRLRRPLAFGILALAMVGCGLSVVGGAAGSSGGPEDGGREASLPPNDPNDPPDATDPDASTCDGAPTCAPFDLVVLAPGQIVRAVAVTDANLFFINATAKTIVRVDLDGSNPTDLVTTAEPARQLTTDGTYVWYTGPDLHSLHISTKIDSPVATGISGCVSLDPAANAIYAADFDDDRIVSVAYGTIIATDLLTADAGVRFPWGVAATDTDVYFTTSGTRPGIIYKRPKNGTTNTTIKQDQANPNCLTFDETGALYWVNNADGSIHRSDADGNNEVVLVSGETNITQVAVDSSFIYWGAENKVRRLAR